MLEVAGDEAVQRARGAEREHPRKEADEVAGAQERAAAGAQDPVLVDRPQRLHERLERARVAGRELRELVRHPRAVGEVQVLCLAGPVDPVVRVQRNQVDLGVEVEPAGREGLLQNPRHRDQGRPGVPGEAAVAQLVRPAARALALVQHGDLVPEPLEPQRRGQPAEPRADDDGPHRRCSSPRALAAGGPAAHVAMRSWRATVARALPARPARAATRSGRASPAATAPSARHFATSTPSRTPPLAITGSAGAAWRASRSASAVGTPQSANARATSPARSSRRPSTSAQFVPPAPATSTAATPARDSSATSAPSMPKPTSLTTTGSGATAATTSAIRSATPAKHGSPSGCTASWIGFRWTLSPSASSRSTSRSARSASSCAAPRFARTSGGRAAGRVGP